jgi:hypothetical protein
MSRPQRKKQFVDAKVQGALARRLIYHWLVFLSVATIVALMLQVLTDPLLPAGEHLRQAWAMHGPFFVVMVFLLPVYLLDTIKLSHRFAGPIVNMRHAMRDIVEGKRPRKLKFRRTDFWHELADDYNAMITRLAPEVDDASADQGEAVEEEQLVAANS